ncbi:MAG: hypothetical protein R3C19_20550 [Planctomycetaceae bacterium]
MMKLVDTPHRPVFDVSAFVNYDSDEYRDEPELEDDILDTNSAIGDMTNFAPDAESDASHDRANLPPGRDSRAVPERSPDGEFGEGIERSADVQSSALADDRAIENDADALSVSDEPQESVGSADTEGADPARKAGNRRGKRRRGRRRGKRGGKADENPAG